MPRVVHLNCRGGSVDPPVDINPMRDFRYFPTGIHMCYALDMRCGARGIYNIECRKAYIEFAKQIYRICVSRYIDIYKCHPERLVGNAVLSVPQEMQSAKLRVILSER